MCLETLQNKCKKDNREEEEGRERERERERESIASELQESLFGVSTTKELQESYCQLGATTKNS